MSYENRKATYTKLVEDGRIDFPSNAAVKAEFAPKENPKEQPKKKGKK